MSRSRALASETCWMAVRAVRSLGDRLPMSLPCGCAMAYEMGTLTSFSRVPVEGFSCSANLPRRRFSSGPEPWGLTLGFPQA